MINISKYINDNNLDPDEFVELLVDNDWFCCEPIIENNEVIINPKNEETIIKILEDYSLHHDLTIDEKNKILSKRLKDSFTITSKQFEQFLKTYEVDNYIAYYLYGFLNKNLISELKEYTDKEIGDLLTEASLSLSMMYCEILCAFISWLKENFKTIYQNDYLMNKRVDVNTDAYEENDYLELMYKLFNENYIQENDMYLSAVDSKKFADTWLFLALHFICALRRTDLIRLPHPILTMSPEETLGAIKEDEFEDKDARAVVYSIMYELQFAPIKPNKTKRFSGVSDIKFFIPESAETLFGKLFAICEAHYQINNCKGPLIKEVSTYEQIVRNMGDDIGDLFINKNFSSRSANKSYLQMIMMLTDNVLSDNEFNTKGYILASLARSHKSSYGEFATTTSIYLKDAKMNGYTPEFVARELFERGPLSFVVSTMLNMVSDGKYGEMDFKDQTKAIKAINMSPLEIENSVSITNKSMSLASKIVNELYLGKEDIISILHKIGNGQANSKCNECMCLMTAMDKLCPYKDKKCIGCKYEISTKATMILMTGELERLLKKYKETSNEVEKNKSKFLATSTVIPAIQEMLTCLEKQYGKEAVEGLERMLEVKNG